MGEGGVSALCSRIALALTLLVLSHPAPWTHRCTSTLSLFVSARLEVRLRKGEHKPKFNDSLTTTVCNKEQLLS